MEYNKDVHVTTERLIKALVKTLSKDGVKVVGATIDGGVGDTSTLSTEATLNDIKTLIAAFEDAGYVQTRNYFIKDGVEVPVTEDTIVPANNAPLPVKITSATGDINITAGDLNVQLTHAGLNPDSVQVGDGTNIMSVNADGSVNVNTSSAVAASVTHISNTTLGVTATQIDATSHPCKAAIVTASETNTGWIRVGGSGVTTTTGVILWPGESFSYPVENTNLLYAIAEVLNEDVAVTYLI